MKLVEGVGIMRNLKKRTLFLVAAGVLSAGYQLNAATWDGTTSNVTNENLTIDGDNNVDDDTTVTADNGGTFTVNCINAARLIATQGAASTSRVTFVVSNNSNLVVNMFASNLTLLSGDAAGEDLSFEVRNTGGASDTGKVTFQLRGSRQLLISGQTGPDSQTRFLLDMEDFSGGTLAPRVVIAREPGDASPNSDVAVVLQINAGIGYGAQDNVNNAEGVIEIQPGSTGTGQFTLRKTPVGSFVLISGREYAGNLGAWTPTTPRGKQAYLNVTNPAAMPCARLIIESETNSTGGSGGAVSDYPSLLADPFDLGVPFNPQSSFILGSNGTLDISDQTYVDYISLTNSGCPSQAPNDTAFKFRNASALITDATSLSDLPTIRMHDTSALYFRSAVGADGTVATAPNYFVPAANYTSGQGETVFDVEGPAMILGDDPNENAVEILSLFVNPSGNKVTIDSTRMVGNPLMPITMFPARTFFHEGNPATAPRVGYNKGNFLINNRLIINTVSINHTNENHQVLNHDDQTMWASLAVPEQAGDDPSTFRDIHSESTYIGGEASSGGEPRPRTSDAFPRMDFRNGVFRAHTNVAFTGLDLQVPNIVDTDNNSRFICYHNGAAQILNINRDGENLVVDPGRSVILGTEVGSKACDGDTLIDRDTHVDIFQTVDNTQSDPVFVQQLALQSGANNNATDCKLVTEGLGSVAGQNQVHQLFQGNNSNITLGTFAPFGFTNATIPTLLIDGNYYGFETRGGLTDQKPENGGINGEGAIFVDRNGCFGISTTARASIATQVMQTTTGKVSLPGNQVYFDNRVGIQDEKVDLTDPDKRVLIQEGERRSDYTFDWGSTVKDTDNWDSYDAGDTPNDPCTSPAVTTRNVSSLAEVKGIVDQFQIKRSKLGDQAHIKVNGENARIGELVFLQTDEAAESPTAFVVLENDGHLGLGNASRSLDSNGASIVLGIDGVTLSPNGDGTVDLNDDVLVDTVAHIVPGPAFGADGEQRLRFISQKPYEIRIKSTAVLDLTNFTKASQVLEIGGHVRLVIEPGAQIVGGGGVLRAVDNAQILFEQLDEPGREFGTLSGSDSTRSKLSGRLPIVLKETSKMVIPRGAHVGVESTDCAAMVDVSITLNDESQLQIGQPGFFGGALQIGNATGRQDGAVAFSLTVDGPKAHAQVNRQGFLGFATGIVCKPEGAPNNWTVGRLSNVLRVGVTLKQGTFSHRKIYSGTSSNASLIAFGPVAESYAVNVNGVANGEAILLGGGNIFRMAGEGITNPTVDTTASSTRGILCSGPTLLDVNNSQMLPQNATNVFNFLSVPSWASQASHFEPFAPDSVADPFVGYVNGAAINRVAPSLHEGEDGLHHDRDRAVAIGAIGLTLGSDGTITGIHQVNP